MQCVVDLSTVFILPVCLILLATSAVVLQANNINVDDVSLQKYVKPYENSRGVDYLKVYQRIEAIHASSGTDISR